MGSSDTAISRNRPITKKDVALVVTFLTVFGGVLRYGEKRLDAVEAKAETFTILQTTHVKDQVAVEREQRQKDIQQLNGKLDTITNILIRMRDGGR